MEVDAGRTDPDGLTTVRPGVGRARTALAVLLVVLPLVIGATLLVLARGEYADQRDERAQDRAALNAATANTLAWGSVDYRELDAYFTAVKDTSTGEFLEQFAATEEDLRSLLVENESVQVPIIPRGGAALLEREGDTARVIIAMDANVSNVTTETPQPREYRLQVTLTRVDGEWRTSVLEFVA